MNSPYVTHNTQLTFRLTGAVHDFFHAQSNFYLEQKGNAIPRKPYGVKRSQFMRSSDGFVLRVAQPFEVAFEAFRLARLANSPAVPD